MGLYLSKRHIPGICQRCGRRVKLSELASEVERGRDRGNAVCDECWDPDHPQNWVGTKPINDKQSVPYAEPEPKRLEINSLFGFNPVGAPGNLILVKTGQVSIIIS